MSLYRQVPEGWQPGLTYQDFLSKRAPATKPEVETFSQRVDRVASTFVAKEVRLMADDRVIGRQVDPNDGLHRVVDAPVYLYDRHYETGGTDV